MNYFLLRQVLELSLLWSLSLSLGEDLWARFPELGVGIIALFFLNDIPALGAGLLVGLAIVSGLAEKSACFSGGGNSDLSMSLNKSDWGFSISQHAKHKAEPPSHWRGLGRRRSAHLSAVPTQSWASATVSWAAEKRWWPALPGKVLQASNLGLGRERAPCYWLHLSGVRFP